jgi:hypothetical protein
MPLMESADDLPYDATYRCNECGGELQQLTGPLPGERPDGETTIDILTCRPCEIVYDVKFPHEEWPFPAKGEWR